MWTETNGRASLETRAPFSAETEAASRRSPSLLLSSSVVVAVRSHQRDAVGRCPLQPLESLQNGALLGLAIEEGMQILHLMTRTNHSTTSKERRRGQTNASNSWCPALLFCSAPIPSLPTDLVARLPLPTTCLWLFNRDFRPVCCLVLFRRALAVHGRRGHGQKERGDGTNDK